MLYTVQKLIDTAKLILMLTYKNDCISTTALPQGGPQSVLHTMDQNNMTW